MNERGPGVRFPNELAVVPQDVLNAYVQAKCTQAVFAFARRETSEMTDQEVRQAAVAAYRTIPPADRGPLVLEQRNLQLGFRHECKHIGCQDEECSVCKHSSHRMCTTTFAPKGYVDLPLNSKCGAQIRVDVIDTATGIPLAEEVPDVFLEMCILDGMRYDKRCAELGGDTGITDSELAQMTLPVTLRGEIKSLLHVKAESPADLHNNKVILPLKKGTVDLPELMLASSCEAMLSGRKPTFRLLVRAVTSDGDRVPIKNAVSDGFVVITKRAKVDEKKEIPAWTDPVKKLGYVGKETVRKLSKLQIAGFGSIEKVGELHKLLQMADADPDLCARIQSCLGLKRDQYDSVRSHTFRAVLPGKVLRTWFPLPEAELGLLFCLGDPKVEPFRPLAMLQREPYQDADSAKRIVLRYLLRQQRQEVVQGIQQLKARAHAAWWEIDHPGWRHSLHAKLEDFAPFQGILGDQPPQPVIPAQPLAAAALHGAPRGLPHDANGITQFAPSEDNPRKRTFRQLASNGDSGMAPWELEHQRLSLEFFPDDNPSFGNGLVPGGLLAQRSNSMPPDNDFGPMPGGLVPHNPHDVGIGPSSYSQGVSQLLPEGFPRRSTSPAMTLRPMDLATQGGANLPSHSHATSPFGVAEMNHSWQYAGNHGGGSMQSGTYPTQHKSSPFHAPVVQTGQPGSWSGASQERILLGESEATTFISMPCNTTNLSRQGAPARQAKPRSPISSRPVRRRSNSRSPRDSPPLGPTVDRTTPSPGTDESSAEEKLTSQQITEIANLRTLSSGSPQPILTPFHPPSASEPVSRVRFAGGSNALPANFSSSIPFPTGWHPAGGQGQQPGGGVQHAVEQLSEQLSDMKGLDDGPNFLDAFPSTLLDLMPNESFPMLTSADAATD